MRLLSTLLLASLSLPLACEPTVYRRSDDDDGGTITSTGTGGDDGPGTSGVGGFGGSSSVSVGSTGITATASSVATDAVAVSSTVTSVASTSTGGMNCLQAFDCPQCFCDQDQLGCTEYLNAVIDHIYCGTSCAADCAGLCNDPSTAPSPSCDGCVQNNLSQGDIDSFFNTCTTSPNCSNFLNNISSCP